MPWKVNILTLFPEIFPGPLQHSIMGKALEEIVHLDAYNIRMFATDKHKTVDDTPYGGGHGMILKADVLGNAIDEVFHDPEIPIIMLSPRGERFNQGIAESLSQKKGINLICGRFEGVDERVFQEYSVRELSIGDYVLSGGDVAALVLLDACIRLLPGVLGNSHSLLEESFATSGPYKGMLEYPHYTKPREWRGHAVPKVLLSGNHAEIESWRFEQSRKKTKQVRPDLWDQCMNGEIK